MRFKKCYEKYTKKEYWYGSGKMNGMSDEYNYYIIKKRGGGFDLFTGHFSQIRIGRQKKVCHVETFDSAKKIANLIENNASKKASELIKAFSVNVSGLNAAPCRN
jgi:hypothetical protein